MVWDLLNIISWCSYAGGNRLSKYDGEKRVSCFFSAGFFGEESAEESLTVVMVGL